MLKFTAITVILTAHIILTACGGDAKPKSESNTGIITTESLSTAKESEGAANDGNELKDQDVAESSQTDEAIFESGQLINLKSYQDQLTEENASVLTVLENNLVSLIDHNNTLYRSGFVNKKLADAMKYYYGEQFRYRFTDIESIEQNLPNENVHITVIGQRLDMTTRTIEDMRMMYAFRQNDQGEWMIYTID